MAEQSLNKKHPDFKSTAETFVQIYKEKKQSFRHHETLIINSLSEIGLYHPGQASPMSLGSFKWK